LPRGWRGPLGESLDSSRLIVSGGGEEATRGSAVESYESFETSDEDGCLADRDKVQPSRYVVLECAVLSDYERVRGRKRRWNSGRRYNEEHRQTSGIVERKGEN